MCAVIGALVHNIDSPEKLRELKTVLHDIWRYSHERGRDGRGWDLNTDGLLFSERSIERRTDGGGQLFLPNYQFDHGTFIANMRAEPTTEHVVKKEAYDQQPYALGEWTMVHNGTIANDKDWRSGDYPSSIDSAAIIELLANHPEAKDEGGSLPPNFWAFKRCIEQLKGSFAIIAANTKEPNRLYVAANYRPIWYVHTHLGAFFASSRDYLPGGYARQMVQPYTVSVFEISKEGQLISSVLPLLEPPEPRRALVVCSGGLDSVVAAAVAKRDYEDVQLIHFLYGSRAQGPEVEAIKRVSSALGVEATIFNLPVYQPGDSPLLRDDGGIAGGEAGAEFAHEWVPARNLVMLSVATAYAEANGFDTIVLGNNLEEAGAYPDNEPEFISKFNDLLPFAVADGKQVQVIMPVGNLMKHEIVALGHQLGAPLEHTWSCYRAGEKHCGTCGPCYMRRKAFEINNLPEVIEYELPVDKTLRP
jgi:7-cyano-7-deazaguanine synthase